MIVCDTYCSTICVSSQHWNFEGSPRLEALLFSTRGGPFRLLLPLPTVHTSVDINWRGSARWPAHYSSAGECPGICQTVQTSACMPVIITAVSENKKCYHLPEWRKGSRRVRRLPRKYRERAPKAKEEGKGFLTPFETC